MNNEKTKRVESIKIVVGMSIKEFVCKIVNEKKRELKRKKRRVQIG